MLQKSSHLFNKALLTQLVLYKNTMSLKTTNFDRYLEYKYMLDAHEYYLWKTFKSPSLPSTREDVYQKISNIGSMFHNPLCKDVLIFNNGKIIQLKQKKILSFEILPPSIASHIHFPLQNTTCHCTFTQSLYLQSLMFIVAK